MANLTIAIIPARGGSKGIPHKNIVPLCGKPLIAYTIEQAINTKSISHVYVSTDDKEISAVAKLYGAVAIRRPVDISGDIASSELALLHVLNYLKDSENLEPEIVVFLQATSPLRRTDDIQNAIDTLQRENADSLFSCCSVHGFVWRKEREVLSSFSYDYRNRQMRQNAPEDFVENGSIYVFKPWVIRKYNNRLGGKIATYRMHALDSFQIDEPEDVQIMEQLIHIRGEQQRIPDFTDVKLLVLDFDGVMTDDRVHVDETGRESVVCHRGDGWGIARIKESGMEIVVLSTEKNPVVSARCEKLGIECIQGSDDKLSSLQNLVLNKQLLPENVAYVGNDVNDLECLKWVGLPIAVSNSCTEVLDASVLITKKAGGAGAIREISDLILSQTEK